MIRDPLQLLRYSSIPILLTLLVAVPGARTGSRALGDLERVPGEFLSSFVADSAGLVHNQEFVGGELLIRRFHGGSGGTVDGEVEVLIATVPDPVESSLDWAYDSYLVSIRRALEERGRVYDRSWFPSPSDSVRLTFPDSASGSVGDISIRVPQSDALPGVILFRETGGDPGLTLVYLVGELPTAGVHREALRAALSERRRILSTFNRPDPDRDTTDTILGRDTIRVLGPSFSGSAVSLRQGLEEWATSLADSVHYTVATGAATSRSVRTVLGSPVPDSTETRDPLAPTFTFMSTVHSDDAYMLALREDVLRPLGIEREEVAFVVEGNTAYGRSLVESGFNVITFPTNIAAVRHEYARNPEGQQSIASTEPVSEQAPRLPLSLSARPRNRESPPPRSSLTPAALDLVLQQIGSTLQRHEIRAIGILATDVRDKLFLARILKGQLRDAQLFTFESNLLFLRPDFARSLRGMLVLSTYPLVTENQTWTGAHSGVLPFSHDGAQGVYNATLALFGRSESMIGYRPPLEVMGRSETDRGLVVFRPPVWITTVGRGTFLPVRTVGVLDGYLTPFAHLDAAKDETSDRHRVGVQSWIIVLAASLVLYTLSRAANYWWRRRGGENPLGTLDEISSIHWIAGLSVLVPLAALSLSPESTARPWLAKSSCALLTIGLTFHLLRHSVGLLRRFRQQEWWDDLAAAVSPPKPSRLELFPVALGQVVVPIAALCLGVLAWTYAIQVIALYLSNYSGLMLYRYRVLQLDGGASPLLPLALSGFAMVLARAWYIERRSLLREGPPLEQIGGVDTPDDAPWSESFRQAGSAIRRVRRQMMEFAPVGGLGWLAIILGLVIVFGLPLRVGFRTVEDVTFPDLQGFSAANLIVSWTLSVGVLTIFASSIHLLLIWNDFSKGLEKVAETPLLAAFGRVPDRICALGRLNLFDPPSSDRGAAVSGAAFSRLDGLIRQRETEQPASAEGGPDPKPVRFRAPETPESYKTKSASVARVKMLLEDLTKIWHERPALVELAAQSPGGQLHENPDVHLLRQAESAAAIEMIRFVDWVIRALRRIAILLLVSILITTALLVSFPTPVRGQVTVVFMLAMVFSMGIVVMIAASMSQDEVLSRVNRTQPGKITWNRATMLSVVVFVSLPIIGLLAAEVPAIGRVLFSWLDPVLRVLTNI